MSQITLDELRPLDSATDSIAAVQSGSWSVDAVQSGAWTVAATQSGSWSVDANITNATLAVTQSGAWTVGVNDITLGGNSLVVNADGSINAVVSGTIEVDDVSDDILVSKVAVTGTSALVVASPLAGRRKITLQNLGAQDVYINKTTATANDIKVPKKSSATFFWSDALAVAAITASGTADVRVLEEKQV